MKVRCAPCGTIYRIDPEKVPTGGVRARCARCSGILEIDGREPPREATAWESPAGDSERATADRATLTNESSHTAEAPPDGGGVEDVSETVREHAPVEADDEPLGAPPFGAANPHERARRLARALVSDIVAYHGERREAGLREGRLRQELGPEIRKSWDAYTAQVGNQMARETSYFQDALNEILARGVRLF